MRLAATIVKCSAISDRLGHAINGTEVAPNIRARLAGACLGIAGEHQQAVVLLAKTGLCRGAFALMHLAFENYARGVWLHRCATALQIDRVKNGKPETSLAQLLKDLDDVPGFAAKILSAVKQASWADMNHFAHAACARTAHMNSQAPVESDYPEAAIVEVINFATAIALLSSLEIALLAENVTLAESLLRMATEFGATQHMPSAYPVATNKRAPSLATK